MFIHPLHQQRSRPIRQHAFQSELRTGKPNKKFVQFFFSLTASKSTSHNTTTGALFTLNR